MKRQSYSLKRKGNDGFGRAKKRFGQHFLNDDQTAEKIVSSLKAETDFVVEIGPGRGILTKFLLEKFKERFHTIEIDRDLLLHLSISFPELKSRLHHEDFLKTDLPKLFPGTIAIIGNFPYNISSQIIFRVLEHREQVKEVVGMFQKEVARRIVANPGTKDYGIISALLPCWYDREYLFELSPADFNPPPKVYSAVVRLLRNQATSLGCDEALFKTVVKTAFNQRRKMLRNSLSGLMSGEMMKDKIFEKRPEQLSFEQFAGITRAFEKVSKKLGNDYSLGQGGSKKK